MGKKPTKLATKLPDRTLLQKLAAGKPTALDYAKATPVKPETSISPVLQQLQLEHMQRR